MVKITIEMREEQKQKFNEYMIIAGLALKRNYPGINYSKTDILMFALEEFAENENNK